MGNILFILFGATGDLSRRYIIPALATHNHQQNISILAIGRKELDNKQFLNEYANEFLDENQRDIIKKTLIYEVIDYQDASTYKTIKNHIEQCNAAKIIAYCSTPPNLFPIITEHLNANNITQMENFSIAYEKPFGSDLNSATELQKSIEKNISEEKIYRVDHYLGKRMVNQIIPLRMKPEISKYWNSTYIESVTITISETLGIGTRGIYYDKSGALKDMTQNHLFQVLGLVSLALPQSTDAESLRAAKAKVFSEIRKLTEADNDIIFGQYTSGIVDGKEVPGYLEEEHVEKGSRTETFVAMKLHIDNEQWNNTPFYLITGKRLNKRYADIKVRFKNQEDHECPKEITISIQPNEFIRIEYQESSKNKTINTDELPNDISANGYENIIHALMKSDKSLFTRWDELLETWKLLDDIINCKERCPLIQKYESGSKGPESATIFRK